MGPQISRQVMLDKELNHNHDLLLLTVPAAHERVMTYFSMSTSMLKRRSMGAGSRVARSNGFGRMADRIRPSTMSIFVPSRKT
jgi:hypothetical protein